MGSEMCIRDRYLLTKTGGILDPSVVAGMSAYLYSGAKTAGNTPDVMAMLGPTAAYAAEIRPPQVAPQKSETMLPPEPAQLSEQQKKGMSEFDRQAWQRALSEQGSGISIRRPGVLPESAFQARRNR